MSSRPGVDPRTGFERMAPQPREGQVWELELGGPVLIVGRVVPSWGPGYELGVHDAVYLEHGSSCLLEESYLLTNARRLL